MCQPDGRSRRIPVPFTSPAIGEKTQLTFQVTAPAQLGTASLRAIADVNGGHFDNQRVVIAYAHIPVQLLQPAARLKVVSLEMAIRGQRVGYLPGAGDSVAENLAQMGYAVTTLIGADLTPEKLHGLDAVVIGVRAFNERADLAGKPAGPVRLRRSGRHRDRAIQPAEWPEDQESRAVPAFHRRRRAEISRDR